MDADPTTLLSTITATSATLVAIIGGLLVARFLGLESEQQGAQRVLNDTTARLEVARQRLGEAADDLRDFDAHDFFDDPGVLKAVAAGTTDLADLRRERGKQIPLTDDELAPHLDRMRQEYQEARDFIRSRLKGPPHSSVDELRSVRDEWYEVEKAIGAPETRYPDLWENAFLGLLDEWGATEVKSPYSMAIPNIAPARDRAAFEQQRSRLLLARDHAETVCEDLEHDAKRLTEQRDAIVRPDRQLWIGLAVLLYSTVVGVVLPVMAMADAPTEFTRSTTVLVYLFCSELAAMLGYMAYLAGRLSLRHRRLPKRDASATTPDTESAHS